MKIGIANDYTVAKMTLGWEFGIGADSRTFTNDRVANEMRTSSGIEKAREDFYRSGKTSGLYEFGLRGLWNAGFSPVQQFVGSYTYTISTEGNMLKYTLSNTTSFSSYDYHLTPSRWDWSSGPHGKILSNIHFYRTTKKMKL